MIEQPDILELANSMLVAKRSFLHAVSNIFGATSNVECSSVNSSDTFDFNSPPIIIDEVRNHFIL